MRILLVFNGSPELLNLYLFQDLDKETYDLIKSCNGLYVNSTFETEYSAESRQFVNKVAEGIYDSSNLIFSDETLDKTPAIELEEATTVVVTGFLL